MQNKKVIIAIILCIGAVISLIYGITSGPKAKRKPGSESASSPEAVSAVKRIIPTKRQAAKTEFVVWGRNPFVPKGTPGTLPSKLVLGGIMWHEENLKAMINNVLVGIGDKIGENTVVDIKKDSVILNNGTEDFELHLAE